MVIFLRILFGRSLHHPDEYLQAAALSVAFGIIIGLMIDMLV